jgi:hypothetical protein
LNPFRRTRIPQRVGCANPSTPARKVIDMARPIHPHRSPVIERFFSTVDHTFGIPKRIIFDNSQEVCDVGVLEALIRAQVDPVYEADSKRSGEDADA